MIQELLAPEPLPQRDFSLPTSHEAWSVSRLPGPKLAAAWRVIGPFLWSSMAAEARWWGSTPERCVWASCAAAEFLSRLGFPVDVVSAVLQVFPASEGTTGVGVAIGSPDPGRDDPGLHNLVLVSEGRRRWVLETSLWQAHRPRFGRLPDLLLAEVRQHTPGSFGLFRRQFAGVGAEFLTVHTERRSVGALGIGWGIIKGRDGWKSIPDARPERAKAIARRLEDVRKRLPAPFTRDR